MTICNILNDVFVHVYLKCVLSYKYNFTSGDQIIFEARKNKKKIEFLNTGKNSSERIFQHYVE